MSSTTSLWRICAETRQYKANDLSGLGAAKFPGRWNDEDQCVIYCASTLSLAVLETASHIVDAGLPQNRFVVRIDVPKEIWLRRRVLRPQDLDAAWPAIPHGRASIDAGSEWYLEGAAVLLQVPSVLVPEESAILVNATHPDVAMITAKTIRPFEYNRLFRALPP